MSAEDTLLARAKQLFPELNAKRVRVEKEMLTVYFEHNGHINVPPSCFAQDKSYNKYVPKDDPRRRELHILAKLLGVI